MLSRILFCKKYLEHFSLLSLLTFVAMCAGTLLPKTLAAATTQFPLSESASKATEDAIQRGLELVRRGDFENAVVSLSIALERHKKAGASEQQIETLIGLSDAYQAMGDYAIAIDYLQKSLPLIENRKNRRKASAVMSRLGNAYSRLGRYGKATDYLKKGLDYAREIGDPRLEATILNIWVLCKYQWEIPKKPNPISKRALTLPHRMRAIYSQAKVFQISQN